MRRVQKNPDTGNVKHRWPVLAIVLGVTLADIVVKYIAVTSFPTEEAAAFPFGLALHKNPGIAFDIPVPLWIIIPITGILMTGLARIAVTSWSHTPRVSLSAITMFLGAGDNLIDRLLNGFTTDYLILFSTSAINLADVLIVLGAISLLSYTHHNPSARIL